METERPRHDWNQLATPSQEGERLDPRKAGTEAPTGGREWEKRKGRWRERLKEGDPHPHMQGGVGRKGRAMEKRRQGEECGRRKESSGRKDKDCQPD